MSELLQACIAFLKVGAFSFGGGYAVLAFIQREIIQGYGWLHPEDFVNIVAIAELTPGPIAVNSSTFVGYNLFGILGGILCSLCTVAVPFALSLLVSIYFKKFKHSPHLKAALQGIRPTVVGLIAASCLSVAQVSVSSLSGVCFFLLALFLVGKVKLNPILTLVTCGTIGGIFFSLFPHLVPH